MSNKQLPADTEEEASELRQRKYWELSSFYNHVKFMQEHHPQVCADEIINKFIDNQEYEAKAWKQLVDYEAEVWRSNERLLKVIKKVKGPTFHKHLLSIIKSLDRVDDKMTIEKEPAGEWQEETDCGRTIKEVWVDQWATGIEGDSWGGYLWVKLKENKFLKIGYSM